MRLPLVIVFAIIAFNFTMFALMLQMDMLMFHSVVAKVIAWFFTAGVWVLTFVYRKKVVKLF